MSWFKELIEKQPQAVKLCIEMSGNHQGCFETAKRFVAKAPTNAQVCLKFQVYTPDTITMKSQNPDFLLPEDNDWSKFKTFHDLYTKAFTPWDWVEELAAICESKSMPWFASPFDTTAVEFLEQLGCQGYKIASPEITDIGLIDAVSKTGKPVVLSTGLATWSDLDLAVSEVRKHHQDFAILKCTSAYPTPIDELNLSVIPRIKERYNCAVGISDHSLSQTAAIVAVALGATIVEKHFKLDDDKTSVDNHFSENLSCAEHFLHTLNDAFLSLGDSELVITKSAIPSLNGKRSLYFDRCLSAGSIIDAASVRSVRPSFGLHPKYLPQIIGKRLLTEVNKGDRVTSKVIEDFTDD